MVSSLPQAKVNSFADFAFASYWFIWLHIVIGSLTVCAGLWLVLQMNDILPQRLHVKRWKDLMRLTLAGYWLVAILGIATYRAWYAE